MSYAHSKAKLVACRAAPASPFTQPVPEQYKRELGCLSQKLLLYLLIDLLFILEILFL